MFTRRQFLHGSLGLAGLALVTGCSRLGGQQPGKTPRIGVISSSSFEAATRGAWSGIRRGLAEHGYEEGQNILIEWRALDNRLERAGEVIAELLSLNVAAIISGHQTVVLTAKQATSTVPIVMAGVFTDPVGQGAVRSLNRPGENVTGLSIAVPTLGNKRFEVLKDAVPSIRRLGLVWDRTMGPTGLNTMPEREDAVRSLGMEPRSIVIGQAEEIGPAFEAMRTAAVDAVHVSDGSMHALQAQLFAELAMQHRLPSICGLPPLVRAGLLMGLGIDQVDLQRRSVGFLDKILKGANPGDLPVEQPTAFDYIVNLKTAQALGLTISQTVLAQATEIIQ